MAVGMSIAIERYIFLNRARAQNRKLWAQVLPMLQNGRFKEVHNVTSNSDAAIGKTLVSSSMIDRVAEGFHARVVQHECDHLDGTLYPMRVRDFGRFGFTEVLFPEISAAEDD
mgnify:CR=1 FL=1